MNILVFDTETTSLEKPFCYNVGYTIVDTDNDFIPIVRREYVIEQVWHNPELFCSAYYADKRPIYVHEMRARHLTMEKWGYVTQQMCRDVKVYGITRAFAYNSSFDEKVFAFNCNWFKTINPFDNVQIVDIRGFVHRYMMDRKYFAFCEENNLFTDTGNYSTTAEGVYRFISNNADFEEAHTALADADIETEILKYCIDMGADIMEEPQAKRSIERKQIRTFTIKKNKEVLYKIPFSSLTFYKKSDTMVLKD